jgi:hypothetical protein
MRYALLSAFALFAVSGVFAGSAKADVPLQVTFNNGALDIGPLLKGVDVLDNDPNTSGHQGTNTVVVTGTVTDVGGAYQGVQTFTIPSGPGGPSAGFHFTVWNATTAGQNLTIDVVMDTNLVGTYNFDTGALSTSPANFRAIITVQDADTDNDDTNGLQPGDVFECELGVTDGGTPGSGPFPMSFSTENSPTPPSGSFLGERFSPAFPPGTGAVTALWSDTPQAVATDMTPDPGESCALVQGIQHGAGGLWLAKDKGHGAFARQPAPPATTPPATTTPTTPKKCKKGQKLKKGKCVKAKKKKKKK